LTVIGAARKQDSSAFIKDRSGAAQSYFALFAQAGTVENLCHFEFLNSLGKISALKKPVDIYISCNYPVNQRNFRGYVTAYFAHLQSIAEFTKPNL
jgi:hypothetical protein